MLEYGRHRCTAEDPHLGYRHSCDSQNQQLQLVTQGLESMASKILPEYQHMVRLEKLVRYSGTNPQADGGTLRRSWNKSSHGRGNEGS